MYKVSNMFIICGNYCFSNSATIGHIIQMQETHKYELGSMREYYHISVQSKETFVKSKLSVNLCSHNVIVNAAINKAVIIFKIVPV